MKKIQKKYVVITLVLFALAVFILSTAVNFGMKLTLMADRKDMDTMVTELADKFGTDYNLYKDLPAEQVIIKSEDDLYLQGVYHNVHPESKKVVIFNHGYTANHYVTYQYTDLFFEEGYNALLIDMRSHGESDGDIASYGYYESRDIGSWIEWIKNTVGDDAYIGLHGQSMGAATVMIYAGANPENIEFVIEDCGFTSAREAIQFQFSEVNVPFWPLYDLMRLKTERVYDFDLDEVSPLESISSSSVPTLFIHGTADTIVPSWMAETLYESKQGEKDRLYLVEGAEHMEAYSKDREQYKKVVRDFLDSIGAI